MKIGNPNVTTVPQSTQAVPLAASGAGAAAQASGEETLGAGDQLRMSALSSYLSGPPSQVARLIELESAVSTEGYQADARSVSDSIIRDSLARAAAK